MELLDGLMGLFGQLTMLIYMVVLVRETKVQRQRLVILLILVIASFLDTIEVILMEKYLQVLKLMLKTLVNL